MEPAKEKPEMNQKKRKLEEAKLEETKEIHKKDGKEKKKMRK